MDHSEPQRAYVSGEKRPPIVQKGRPPYTAERPRSAHSERDYRSRSRNPRPGSRSRSQQGRDSDAMSMESRTEETKTTKSKGRFLRAVERMSPKAALKQQFSMSPGSMDMDVPKSPSSPTSTTSVLQNRSHSRKHVGGHFDPSIPTVQQNSVIVSQTTATRNGVVNCEQVQVTQTAVSAPVHKTATLVHENALYSPKMPQAVTVKDLPPDPPLHESHASNAIGHDSTANEQENFKNVIHDQVKVMDDLSSERETLIRILQDERTQHVIKVQELNQEIAKWKARAIDAASKSANVPAQAPLSRPESELLKDWRNLAFVVRNLVANHFGSVREGKVASWAKVRSEWLREVTPTPVEVASGKKSGSALIEAAIWEALIRFVLGGVDTSGPMCWAGRYKGRLCRLITRLRKDLAQKEPGQQSDALYYQWKALTASIISTVQVPQDRNEEVDYVVEELEDILAPCRSWLNSSGPFHRELQAVVNKAIELDLKFSGQQAYYAVGWPNQGRCNVNFDQSVMQLAAGSPKSSRNVRFMIQPCLFRAGGQGESFDNYIVIDHCSVWMS